MARQGYISTRDLQNSNNLQKLKLAGLVLIRQRPGTAKGVCFITLEDEFGTANLVVWPKVMAQFRKTVMQSRLLSVEGYVQRDVEIIHIVAQQLTDRSDALLRLAPDTLGPAPQGGSHGHPRNTRVIHKSRDFH